MIPGHYTEAERAAYAQARADASRDFQASLTAGMRPTQDAAWVDGWKRGAAASVDEQIAGVPPADRPYAPPASPGPEPT
jgi:hypothetical protein